MPNMFTIIKVTFTFSEIANRYAASLSVQSPSRKLYVFVPVSVEKKVYDYVYSFITTQ